MFDSLACTFQTELSPQVKPFGSPVPAVVNVHAGRPCRMRVAAAARYGRHHFIVPLEGTENNNNIHFIRFTMEL